jgi:hypothetical protein
MRCPFAATALLLAFVAVGCFAPTSPSQRLADAAIDMNTATRFGRMDIAMEYVGGPARADFVRRHAAWHKRVRIVDLEFGGMDLKEKDEADVIINVTWQLPEDAIIRETRITQRWKDTRGTWSIVAESVDGDPGLWADKPKKVARPVPIEGAMVETPAQPIELQRTRVIQGD